jgi:hypothetical protein
MITDLIFPPHRHHYSFVNVVDLMNTCQTSSPRSKRSYHGGEPIAESFLFPQKPPKRAKLQKRYSHITQSCQDEQQSRIRIWNSLSKVWLTRRALEQQDRETRYQAQPASARLPLLSSEGSCEELKRFARHGGPDLCDIRGACWSEWL